MIFEGSCVALVTPFKNNKIDYAALQNLIEFQLGEKTDAILILGTTGESSCVSFVEREKIIDFAKNIINGKAKLIVGTGSNNTQTAIKYTKQAKKLGADAALVVSPYYNKCTQQGAILHFEKIANCVDMPIILYNVPSRTGFNINPQTVAHLSKCENIVAIKEANSNIEHILQLFNLCKDKIDIYCGNDNLNHIFKSLGAKGTISVVANVFPKQIKQQYKIANQNKQNNLAEKLYDFCNLCFIETNPIPIKYVLFKMGLIQNELRLPLCPLSQQNSQLVWDCYQKTKGQIWKFWLLVQTAEWVIVLLTFAKRKI